MSVWYCIPSKRPPEEAEKCLKLWRERGYKIALWLDAENEHEAFGSNEENFLILAGRYPGYAAAVNSLVKHVIMFHEDAEWLVTGGDDIEPDANHSAEEIAAQCSKHFTEAAWPKCWHWDANYPTPEAALAAGARAEQKPQGLWSAARADAAATFGVMQPTGDRYGANERHIGELGSAYIDRVCGSPWMGREFCRRMYGGRGPLCEEYFHMGEDEELQHVALKLGVLWQRPDLIHFHRHWARARRDRADMPAFLERANSPEEWLKYKEIFRTRQQLNFPGHEPLEG